MDAASWIAEHGAGLQGLRADRAERAVRDAGLRPRVVAPGAIVTLEHRSDRVDLQCDADGVVTAVRPG